MPACTIITQLDFDVRMSLRRARCPCFLETLLHTLETQKDVVARFPCGLKLLVLILPHDLPIESPQQ